MSENAARDELREQEIETLADELNEKLVFPAGRCKETAQVTHTKEGEVWSTTRGNVRKVYVSKTTDGDWDRNDGGTFKVELFENDSNGQLFKTEHVVHGDRKKVWFTGRGRGKDMYVKITTTNIQGPRNTNKFYVHVEWWC